MKKKLLLLVSVFCLSILLFGCGARFTEEDAKAYVKSALDASYKGEFKDYMEITGATEEEALAMYNEGMDVNMENSGFDEMGASEETLEQFRQLFADIYKSADYEITGVTKNEDNFEVEVTLKPIAMFETLEEDLLTMLSEHAEELAAMGSEEEMNEFILQQMHSLMTDKLAENAVLDPVTVPVLVEKDSDGAYSINQDSLYDVENALIVY